MTLGFLLAAGSVVFAAEAPNGEELFVRRIWPLFEEKCLACHGKDEKKIKGGLDLRTREAAAKGGESALSAFVPAKPDESPLYLAVTRTHDDWDPMPPKENDRLTAEQIGAIKEWISAGAAWPDGARRQALTAANAQWSAGVPVRTSGGLSVEWTNRRYKPENLWAYRRLERPPVPAKANPIDALIAARWQPGVQPAAPADRRTLIRRATFDLLGLPPTPEEIEAFVDDRDADEAAFSRVVERLLASPRYGEQWGRHWLDVVRYADSSGFANDYERGNAWRYRDYVIRAFNNDKPYDRFIREQIAGDEIDADDPEVLIATGFLRMGPWELTAMEVAKIARQRFLDDVTQSVGETFLAHALQCARCHDHKFDPVPTRDYYAMQACFATTQLAERPAPFQAQENTAGFAERKYLEQRRADHLAVLQALDEKSLAAADAWFREKQANRDAWDAAVAAARTQDAAKREFTGVFEGARRRLMAQKAPEDQFPPKLLGFTPEDFGRERVARKGLERLRWEFERYEPTAFAVYSGRTPELKAVTAPLRMPEDRMTAGELEETSILHGGDPFSPVEKVVPAVLSAPSGPGQVPAAIAGRRLALAEWIASPKNPLTARVMANRIWLWHFGRALAGNPNNFGSTGKKPTHPELLDWLACELIERGWSVKAMHRLIMSSEAYRRSASAGASASAADYSVFQPRRLAAEELRDTTLSVSGELSGQLGGIPARPEINLEAALQPRQVMGTFADAWVPNPEPAQRHRRSVYALHIRGLRDPFMEVFNEPSPDLSCEARDASTVTPQAFAMFNSRIAYERALAFAARILRETGSREDAIRRAFELAFGRAPSAHEFASCLAHWESMTARHRTLHFEKTEPQREVVREAIEENTGEKFTFPEKLGAYADFIPDLEAAGAPPETRGLAEVCLVLLNANEFAYVY